MKVCDSNEKKWPTVMQAIFWAEHITTHRALGHSSYYIAHGVEPLLPFDICEATYMFPPQDAMTTIKLVALCARQLQKWDSDLATIHDRVLRACFTSIRGFIKHFSNSIRDFNFQTGDLVLAQNSRIEKSLTAKRRKSGTDL